MWKRRELRWMRSWACKGLAQIYPCKPSQQNCKWLTVAAGPGSCESGTNVVPRQVAMEEDANLLITAGTSSNRKRLTWTQKRKLRRQALRANEAASGATALESPVASRLAPKRRKDSKDTPPEGMRNPKRPKPVRLPANIELSGVGLSAAQRTNPLTVIVADAGYPESVLSPEQFIFVASNSEAKAWLTKTAPEPGPWEGANLKVSRVEILQKMLKATAWISGKPEDPAVVLRRLKGFNPSLKIASWRIVWHERPQEANATGVLKYLLVV